MRSFVDKLADKTRLRRARHKGGYVPSKLKKVQVEYFESDKEEDADAENGGKMDIDRPLLSEDENDLAGAIGDSENPTNTVMDVAKRTDKPVSRDNEQRMNRKTVEMYDLMLKTGTKVKAYSKQDEDKLKAKIKLKKLGLNSISELDRKMQQELLNAPGLEDELNSKRQNAKSQDSDDGEANNNNKSSSEHHSSDDEDLLEEFKRETERDIALTKEREETRQQKLIERKTKARERKEMTEK